MSFLNYVFSNRNYFIAILLSVFLILWLASGMVVGDDEDNPVGESSSVTGAAELTTVKARILEAESYSIVVNIRGRTEPNRRIELRARVPGVVERLLVEKGEATTQGDTICELAPEDRREIVAQTSAALKKAELDYSGAQRLQNRGFQSESSMAQTLANLELARAAHKRAEIDLDNLEITAPFDGIVDQRPVEIGDIMQAGSVCAEILDMDPLLVVGEIAEANISKIQVGSAISAELLTGQKVDGTVRFIQRSSDEITRTFRVEAIIDNADLSLLSGISASLYIPLESVQAHRINSSLLILDDEGLLGVRTLTENNIVQYQSVELVGDDDSGVWVAGLPERVRLITVGQQYVAEGEQVAVSYDTTVLSAAPSLNGSKELDFQP